MKQKFAFYGPVIFYVLAGLNHFLDPEFYYPLIPPYFSSPDVINTLSGVIEIILGLALLWPKTRYISATAIIFMLIAFIPSHVHFIQLGSCISDGLCVPQWVGWVRLLIIHPLLILWAWQMRTYNLQYHEQIVQ